MRPRQTWSAEQITDFYRAQAMVRAKLADPAAQLTSTDVLFLEPSEVTQAVEAGQALSMGIPPRRRRHG